MDGDRTDRLENGASWTGTDRLRLWAVTPGEGRCDHRPEDVEYTGEDGLNLYFQCHRCGASLVAEGAIHLLARYSRPRVRHSDQDGVEQHAQDDADGDDG